MEYLSVLNFLNLYPVNDLDWQDLDLWIRAVANYYIYYRPNAILKALLIVFNLHHNYETDIVITHILQMSTEKWSELPKVPSY